MNNMQQDDNISYDINKNQDVEDVKEIDEGSVKYNSALEVKDQNYMNDMIFRDSVQSGISTPSPDISIDLQDASLNISKISDDTTNALETSSSTASPFVAPPVSPDHLSDFIENIQASDLSNEQITTQEHCFAESSSTPVKDSDQDHTEIFEQLEKIPDRMGFKISEVAFLTGIKSYVLRYWESEFEALKPKKANNNRRIYTQKDVTTILLIKKLLYKDKYSIEGAKKVLRTLQTEIKQQRKVFTLFYQQEEAIKQLRDLIDIIASLKKQCS